MILFLSVGDYLVEYRSDRVFRVAELRGFYARLTDTSGTDAWIWRPWLLLGWGRLP